MDKIKEAVLANKGERVLLISDEGRNIIREEIAQIVEVYDSLFILDVFTVNKGVQRESFRYADILTREVELNSIENNKSIFDFEEDDEANV